MFFFKVRILHLNVRVVCLTVYIFKSRRNVKLKTFPPPPYYTKPCPGSGGGGYCPNTIVGHSVPQNENQSELIQSPLNYFKHIQGFLALSLKINTS